jgi:hypothetical protein
MTKTVVTLLREAAEELRAALGRDLIIPDFDEESLTNPYPLGIQPGAYGLAEVAEAVQFIADMLET